MTLVVEIDGITYKDIKKGKVYSSFRDVPQESVLAIANGIPLDKILNQIRTEIEKPLHDERCFDTADAKAQAIALNWCLEIIDKHLREIEK